jgi:Sulfotransferase family
VPPIAIDYPSLDELMNRAAEQTGLHDFGSSSFRVGFERFIASLRDDANLTTDGAAVVVETITRRLRNRLQVEAWHHANPSAATAAIDGPVCVNGLPRTGTTALGNMLSLDPQFRCLRGWEQRQPCPPPTLASEQNDPRRVEAIRSSNDLVTQRPEQMAMHLWDTDATTEDTDVLGIDGRPQSAPTPVYGYHEWWRTADMRATYAYHRRVATLLQSSRPPNRWLFKSPHMSFHLEDFVDAYPDARFVMTHRDPAKAVPSWVSFVTSLMPPGTLETLDTQRFGQHLAAHLAVGAERCIAARAALGEHRFLDVHHLELVADPMGQVERIYEWLGYPFTAATRAAIVNWSAANRSGAHGAHRYTPEQFGLTSAGLRNQFDSYTTRFGVTLERA